MNIELFEPQVDKITRDRLEQLLFEWHYELESLNNLGGDMDSEYVETLENRMAGCAVLLAYYSGQKEHSYVLCL